jgi:two-component system cell cycle response regulator
MAEESGEDVVLQLRAEVERLKRENERLKVSNRRWMRLAGTDALTGLPNRVYFTTALLPQLISQSNAELTPFACLILAPDQLGEVNQKFGREGGDEIIREVALFLKENLESRERLVHLDGANFAIMIPEGNLSVAKRRGLQLRARALSRPFRCGNEGVILTLSLGAVARSPQTSGTKAEVKETAELVLKKLTVQLDRAKREGRDRLVEDLDTEF